MTFTEGASYSLIILVGLGIAAAAGYAVFKELIFEPKEYELAFRLKYVEPLEWRLRTFISSSMSLDS